METKTPATVKKSKPVANLVVAPAPPETRVVARRTAAGSPAKKRPSDPREYPAARDARGSASRTEIRRAAPRVSAPRKSERTPERGNQPRSHKSGKP